MLVKAIGQLQKLLLLRLQGSVKLLKALVAGNDEKVILAFQEVGQLALDELAATLGECLTGCTLGHKVADTSRGGDYAALTEGIVGTHNGVGVHLQLHGEFPHRGHTVALTPAMGDDALHYNVVDVLVDWFVRSEFHSGPSLLFRLALAELEPRSDGENCGEPHIVPPPLVAEGAGDEVENRVAELEGACHGTSKPRNIERLDEDLAFGGEYDEGYEVDDGENGDDEHHGLYGAVLCHTHSEHRDTHPEEAELCIDPTTLKPTTHKCSLVEVSLGEGVADDACHNLKGRNRKCGEYEGVEECEEELLAVGCWEGVVANLLAGHHRVVERELRHGDGSNAGDHHIHSLKRGDVLHVTREREHCAESEQTEECEGTIEIVGAILGVVLAGNEPQAA